MIEALIAWSIHRRWLVIAGALALSALGAWAYFQIPVDAIPDLSETQLIVFAEWPGHSPGEIETQVTFPLSLHLRQAEGVKTLRGSSEFNYSLLHLIFDDGVQIAAARRAVSERLATLGAELPPDAAVRLAPDGPATGQILWYTVQSSSHDLGMLRAVQDWTIRPQLSGVAGVAEVASVGGFPRELHVTVDPQRLTERGISLETVSRAIAQANAAPAGNVLHAPTAEYFVHAAGRIGEVDAAFNFERAGADLGRLVLATVDGRPVRLADVATVGLGPGPRRGVLEVDGDDAVGGVVLMRYGANPAEVTRALKEKLIEIAPALPPGVYVSIGYDRAPLVAAAVGTVQRTLIEAMIVAAICVFVVMLHWRASLVVAGSLPLTVLAALAAVWGLRASGLLAIESNIMSLAGLAISIGVLVDSSIVMTENVMYRLHERFGDRPVRGDVRELVISACQQVGRPMFFAVLIMLVSFLPVFALGGLEGRMFRPLAITKSLALIASAVLAITVVPALCSLLVRGRIRGERDSWLVRGIMDAYLPLLQAVLVRPAGLIAVVAATILVGLAPLGLRYGGYPVLLLATLVMAVLFVVATARSRWSAALLVGSLFLVTMAADRHIQPLESEFLTPLDEGTAMDMPITIPRASVSQAADDLKARDMVLCRFPEVAMVMGKAGRAETPTDPAPIDMIETMVSFRPRDVWPRRKLDPRDAERCTALVLAELEGRKWIESLSPAQRRTFIGESAAAQQFRFDALLREVAYQRNQELARELAVQLPTTAALVALRQAARAGGLARETNDGDVALLASTLPRSLALRLAQGPTELEAAEAERLLAAELRDRKLLAANAAVSLSLLSELRDRHHELWREHARQLDRELAERAPGLLARLAIEDLLTRRKSIHTALTNELAELRQFRLAQPQSARRGGHHGTAEYAPPQIEPLPLLDGLQAELTPKIAPWVTLARAERGELAGFGGEMDRALQMPGWTNVWTMPIQNRVDMLATGVNTTVGVRVLGERLDDVVEASRQVAELLRQVPGAASVVADPVRGKGYLKIRLRSEAASQLGVRIGDANAVIEAALGGTLATHLAAGRERLPVRVRFSAAAGEDVESLRRLRVSTAGERAVYLGEVAEIEIAEGPASIKSENGRLRNYVRLNVRGRDAEEFVREARLIVAEKLALPSGVHLEWTGQFEHQIRARQRLWLVAPLVLLVILTILYLTYRDLADALLLVPAIVGALAGGLLLQWLLGYKSSITVAVGYIACFGMAASTGIIMLVYLRHAVAQAGGLERITLPELREAVVRGAVHRLRPKLLTEATMILGLAPLLWATGVGSEVIRPMIAPVLGGILVADEVIDLLLPVMFYWVRKRRWQRLHDSPLDDGLEQPPPIQLTPTLQESLG